MSMSSDARIIALKQFLCLLKFAFNALFIKFIVINQRLQSRKLKEVRRTG